jgi:hypothetical protein
MRDIEAIDSELGLLLATRPNNSSMDRVDVAPS